MKKSKFEAAEKLPVKIKVLMSDRALAISMVEGYVSAAALCIGRVPVYVTHEMLNQAAALAEDVASIEANLERENLSFDTIVRLTPAVVALENAEIREMRKACTADENDEEGEE